jgi:outer membrane protein assembly factor BamA
VFDAARNVTLGWLQTEVRWDTTDSERLPYRGWDVGLLIDSALGQSTGDVASIFTLDSSAYVPVPGFLHSGARGDEEHPPVDTLAFHLETSTTAGDLPFFALPTLGGAKTLRGYIAGRFRDRSDWAATAEYRFWIIPRGFALSPWTPAVRVERLGAALFFDTGSVSDRWWELFEATPRYSGGVGARITLERSAPFRVDVGFSGEGVQVTAGFGLSF